MPKTINPHDNTSVFSYDTLTEKEVRNKLIISDKSYSNWKLTSLKIRVNYLLKLSKVLKNKEQELAEMITKEMGKPITQSRAEVQKCAVLCDYYAQNVENFLQPKKIASDAQKSYVFYDSLGVILGVMPWNFPFWQVFRFAVPTIMAGNTVVVKHASNVMGSAALLETIFATAGFPEGVYQNLSIESKMVEAVLADPIVKAVSLTGSEGAGSAVAATAGKYLKKSLLELGGSNAFIICKDADLKKAVAIAVNARMQNAGQSCIAAKRFLVHSDVYDQFIQHYKEAVAKLHPGDPMDPATEIGPMARQDLAEELEKQVQDSVRMGAEIVSGGKRTGTFFEPTVLIHVTPEMPAFKEELFGPVAAVSVFETLEEAIQLSNNSSFGLGVSVFSEDTAAIEAKVHLFEEGAVFINAMVKSDPRLPFGGVKKSGYGRELSDTGLMEFVNIKTIYIS